MSQPVSAHSELSPSQRAAVEQRLTGSGESPLVVVVPAATGRQTVWWVLTVVLAVLATAIITRSDAPLLRGAWAQTAGGLPTAVGARGIYAFTGQLTSKSYGLFMMDVDTGTVWCYELNRGPNGEPQMKLAAARSWIYDRYLEEFNVADPVPSAVKVLVEQQRNGQPAPGGRGVPATGAAAQSGSPVLPVPAGRQ